MHRCQDLAIALCARAMLQTSEGRYDEAWQDLLACHRLGRHVACGGTLIESITGYLIDYRTATADLAHLGGAKLTAKQIKERLRDLQELSPMPPVADQYDLGERLMLLDLIQTIPRKGPKGLEQVADLTGTDLPAIPDGIMNLKLEDIDWDPALRAVNKWYDRMAVVLRMKNQSERKKNVEQYKNDLTNANATASKKLMKIMQGVAATSKERGETLGSLFISRKLPSFLSGLQESADYSVQIRNNLHLAFALIAFHSDHDVFPKNLDELAPKYVPQVPLDHFSGKPLAYQPVGNGFLLYSIGPNGKDDDGQWITDTPPGDDVNVRWPLPKLAKK
jgi:hypothetical protein